MKEKQNLPANCKQVFNFNEIDQALNTLATKLNKQLVNETPLVLCVMQGGLVFSGQLIPKLDCMLEVDYIHATRYSNETSGGELTWKAYPVASLSNRTVLILDDILDEGKTLQSIIQYCEAQGASRILSAVLLKKNHQRGVTDKAIDSALIDHVALTVEDNYVFGFGMDMNGEYRQLDGIYALDGDGL